MLILCKVIDMNISKVIMNNKVIIKYTEREVYKQGEALSWHLLTDKKWERLH